MKIPRIGLILIGALLLFASCVPNRKVAYLQKNDVKKYDLPTDTVVRQYGLKDFDYRIQSYDALHVRFQSLSDETYDFLSRNQPTNAGGGGTQAFIVNSEIVDENGEIVFPGVGKVKVAGLTLFQAQDTLQAIAGKMLEGAVVKVRLVNFRVTVLGEVNQEGTVSTFNPRVTLPEAIGLAGGLGELADRAKIKIVRQKGDSAEVAYVNLLDENVIASPYYYVTQNDVIIVPPLRQRPFRRYFNQNSAIISQNLGIILSATSVVLLIINLTDEN